MNYRHHYHAGNYADVFKHALLVPLLRGMQRKDKGFLYLDTHAGRGGYDLETTTELPDGRTRPPEWPEGIGRLWNDEGGPLDDYLSLARQFNREHGGEANAPRFYPGSPWVAARLARTQDRLALCELREDDAEALAQDFRANGNAAVSRMDGYTALRAMLPPPEKRALVLIDPPFESAAEFADILTGLRDGLKRLPAGVFVVWYPVTERSRSEKFHADLLAMNPPATLVAELQIAGDNAQIRMKGCGLLVLNPPWQVDREIAGMLPELAKKLAVDSGATSRLTWLQPER